MVQPKNAVQKQQCINNGTQDIEFCMTDKEAIYSKDKVSIITNSGKLPIAPSCDYEENKAL
ncbi:MAG: hypothetical protein H9535_09550 [Ignavibacteria bacterium]|nr:hypothetical protein [Ignavibacteria bacterium]